MRKINAFKNFITYSIPYFIMIILGFIKIDIFIKQLGVEVYALNQLFLQLFSYFALLEGGIGVLITQRYSQLFVTDDKEKIKKIYTYSIHFLRKMSLFIFIIGVIVSFALEYITNNSLSLGYMQLVFILFIIKNIIDYIMFSPRFVISAEQKMYKINLIVNAFSVIEAIVDIILLLNGYDYLLILVVGIIIKFILNIVVNKKVFKLYPWLTTVNKKEMEYVTGIRNVFTHKIVGVVFNNTDIVLISALLNPIVVVIYSSYNYIIKIICDVIYMLSNSLTSSFGNVYYKEKKETTVNIFEEINSLFLFLAILLSIVLYITINGFIKIWLGQQFLINDIALIFLISIMFYTISRRTFIMTRDAIDLFKETKIVSIAEAAINLILSLILVKRFGVSGVLFATYIASLLTSFWYYPYYIYNKVFGGEYKKHYLKYYLKYILAYILSIALALIGSYLYNLTPTPDYITWFLKSVVYFIALLILVYGINYSVSSSFRALTIKLYVMLKKIIQNFKIKNKKISN